MSKGDGSVDRCACGKRELDSFIGTYNDAEASHTREACTPFGMTRPHTTQDVQPIRQRQFARAVWMSEDFIDKCGARTLDGRFRITMEWGEPDEQGIYTPTLTTHDDPLPEVAALAAERACADALAEALGLVFKTGNTSQAGVDALAAWSALRRGERASDDGASKTEDT